MRQCFYSLLRRPLELGVPSSNFASSVLEGAKYFLV